MVKDFKYIIRRVIIGVLIALILGFLGTRKVSALSGNFDSVLMCSSNLGCSTSLALPYSYAYADSARLNFSGINLVQGKTYNINFSMTLNSPSFSFNLDYPQLFVIDSSNTPVRAYPDRGNSLQVNNLGNNNYTVNWTFELDNTGGNFTSAYIIFVFTSSYNQNIYSTIINSSNFLYYDLSDPSGNQDIINNQNNNTQNIINNNNSNTEDIINNQNENTQKEIESQEVCKLIGVESISINNYYLFTNGTLLSNSSYGISDYIPISKKSKLTLFTRVPSSGASICFYNSSKTLISCSLENYSNGYEYTIPTNSSYFRGSFNKDSNIPILELCKNGNQAINDSMENINNSINDDSSPDTSSFIEGLTGLFPNQTPVTDLLTLPLTLLNKYMTSMNGTCSPFNLGNLYGTDLIMPCLNLESRLGSTLWNRIDIFMCFFMVYNIGLLLVSIYNDITDLKDTFGSLYVPQHELYKPRHGGD